MKSQFGPLNYEATWIGINPSSTTSTKKDRYEAIIQEIIAPVPLFPPTELAGDGVSLMNYRVVFDIVSVGYRAWWFVAFGVIFVLIGIGLVTFRRFLPERRPRIFHRYFPFVFLGFALLWTTVAFVTTYSEYRTVLTARNNGTATVTEGVVTNFIPMPYSGHADEKFTVNGVTFSYSDYGVTAGFNNTKSHGGPIDEGKRVRVTHLGNIIVRLEVGDGK
jgi:hypothetical protein